MGAIRFRFLENGNPTSAVQNIATAMGEDEAEPEEVGAELGGSCTGLIWCDRCLLTLRKPLLVGVLSFISSFFSSPFFSLSHAPPPSQWNTSCLNIHLPVFSFFFQVIYLCLLLSILLYVVVCCRCCCCCCC